MFNGNYDLKGETLEVVEEIGRHMPGGFFIYQAAKPEKLIYANRAVCDIFGCENLDEFKELTGYTFKGMLHPDDYRKISDSITEQIDTNEDNMDYVEYRIIRKDGEIRWVDDFGHFTETKNYGGVYYVFISDITEKKKQRELETKRVKEENKRLIEEVASAAKLADLMGSVSSLLTNMPAMSFSKDAKSGKYLACNQSFAEYAHKKSPSEVIGLTDYDIFDKDTAKHFVEDDARALSMDSPYIFFEDVPDAKGKLRNLQTTKMKFTDTNGNLCTLGMCVDVTEMTRIKSAEAEARIKQQQLEEKIELQEKLIKQGEAVKEALKAAKEANQAKTNFLSNMSHEIRTPITAILGMNELIRRETDDESILEYTDSINKAGNSLLGIINDILDFSKIEAGRMSLVNADYSIEELVADLSNLIRFRVEEKGLIFNVNMDSNLPVLLNGDELRIKQIITNLLSNAAKYTDKGSITLTVQLVSSEDGYANIYVSVEDTGIGIKEEEKDKLLTAFDRLDVVRNRGVEGTGLGLAITSRMLELMDSTLEVESTYRKGSRFSFAIRQQVIDNRRIGEVSTGEVLAEKTDNNSDTISFKAPDARILIVDDTPLNLKVIAGLLKHTGVKIDTAGSGKECIEIFAVNEYDMVFLDYRMPDMDGIETLKKLYEQYPDKAKDTPIICLTASAVTGDREKMIDAGFDNYLSKPINISAMEQMVYEYLPDNKLIIDESECDAVDTSDELKLLPPAIFRIDGIDAKKGIEYCGDAEEYMYALKIYTDSAEDKASDIIEALDNEDIDTYTILVHSLKSMSNSVGAVAIADLALSLENAGKASDINTIKANNSQLIDMYIDMHKSLKRIL